MFIDASKHFESGKNQNKLRSSDIDKIVAAYCAFDEGHFTEGVVEDKFSFVATFQTIADNDFNLNIPHYVDTFEEEAEVNIAAVQAEINVLEAELKTVQAELDGYLKELMA